MQIQLRYRVQFLYREIMGILDIATTMDQVLEDQVPVEVPVVQLQCGQMKLQLVVK